MLTILSKYTVKWMFVLFDLKGWIYFQNGFELLLNNK